MKAVDVMDFYKRHLKNNMQGSAKPELCRRLIISSKMNDKEK